MCCNVNMAMFHGDKTSFPQCLGVRSEVEFGAPRAARVLVAGSFGLGEILQCSRFLEDDVTFGFGSCSLLVALSYLKNVFFMVRSQKMAMM